MPVRVLITGAGGMLGRELVRQAPYELTALGHAACDITDPDMVADAVNGHDVVINAAAWTDVDAAEADEAAATRINGTAVGTLARACARTGARLIHLSTDYVFAGDADSPYAEDAPTAPINAYGRGKLAGEHAVLAALPRSGYVVRTAWLYAEQGRNFVTTVLRLAAERDTVDVVDDQRGQPTWAGALAGQLFALAVAAHAGRAPGGVYHGTAGGETTWYRLARAVFTQAGLDPDRVRPTTSALFVRPARRPAYSVLGHGRWAEAGVAAQPHWLDGLRESGIGMAR